MEFFPTLLAATFASALVDVVISGGTIPADNCFIGRTCTTPGDTCNKKSSVSPFGMDFSLDLKCDESKHVVLVDCVWAGNTLPGATLVRKTAGGITITSNVLAVGGVWHLSGTIKNGSEQRKPATVNCEKESGIVGHE